MAQASTSPTHELLMQRLELLRALADSLEEAQAGLATTTPERLDQQTARQREICCQLGALAGGVGEEWGIPTDARLADDLQETARRVAELNRFYGALLRRRRRTVDIFCRVLASSGTTYPAPKLVSRPSAKVARLKG
jgi:hypothetical protein